MAVVGLQLVQFALVDDNQKLIVGDDGLSEDGLYTVDSKDLGSKQANITGLVGTTTKVYGNNVPQDIEVGTAAPSVALDINNLDFVTKQKLKGFTSDGKGGWVDNRKKQRVAMLITTQSIDRQNHIYYGFGNGLLTEAEANLQTDQDTEQRVDDALTYTALDTVAFGDQPYKLYSDFEDEFTQDTMMSEVFGGYTAGSGNGAPVTSPTTAKTTTDTTAPTTTQTTSSK